MKRILTGLLSLTVLVSAMALPACAAESGKDVTEIRLSDSGITVDGEAVFGDESAAVYAANDIVYYEAGKGFTYGEGTEADEHEAEEADGHTVVHITRPGTYALSGKLSAGQIAVDLGEDAEEDPDAVVTLIFDGVDITCAVAPAVIFYNVYECGDKDNAVKDVDTSAAGANVVIADGTENVVNGSYVARIYKSYTLSEDGTEVVDNKKLHKYDAAFYSKMSMNVDGGKADTGRLTINAENEGLDSELHLTINGGNIYIKSGNDGINTNEDGVSVTTVNGGTLTIQVTGQTGEGDGIDSNGWLVINGGKVIAAACADSTDAGIDSDMGIHINGGTVMATGNMLDRIEDGGQNYAVFNFAERRSGDSVISLNNAEGEEVMALWPVNDCSVLIFSSPELTAGDYTLWSDGVQLAASTSGGGGVGGFGGMRPEGMERPEGFAPPEGFDPAGMQRPEGMEPPAGMERAELPEDMEPPVGMMHQGGRPGGFGGQGDGVMTKIFAITDGGTMFSRVAEAGEDASDLPFGDVKTDDWCYGAVCWGYDSGIINGTERNKFDPDGNLNRGQVVTMLHRMSGQPETEETPAFSDVTEKTWCRDAVAWAAENGIVLGYADGTFGPEKPISRQQLAAILWRYAQYAGVDVSMGEDTNILSYTDAFDVAEYAIPAMQWSCGAGVIGGYADGRLNPGGTATRAQTVTILQRYAQLNSAE